MRIARPLGLLAGSLALTVAVTEAVCWFDQDGAFPHVNFYVPDAALGVRLDPGASERLSFSQNGVTTLRVNAQGYRGADWPAPGTDDLLVVGDSQVFGLGVEEHETATAVAGAALHRTALNGGVPTYGPDEYLAVVREVLDARPVHDVVLVLNASNDFFELSHANRDRHTVLDGWAVRTETAPEPGLAFPGRSFLFRHSHAVFALRRALAGDATEPSTVPSEGSPVDLLPLAQAQAAEANTAESARRESEVAIVTDVAAASAARDQQGVERDLFFALANVGEVETGDDAGLGATAVLNGRGVGDIVFDSYAEGGRSTAVTAALLEAGAKLRKELPIRAAKWLEGHPNEYESDQMRALLAAWRRPIAAPDRDSEVIDTPRPASAFHDLLTHAKALCDEHHAALTVVMLPLDVQVSDLEWAKYGAAVADMSASRALNREVIRDASALGVRTVDPLAALQKAEPGAFLHGDLHLSVAGQRVVGEAIAAAVSGPDPVPWPGPGLPKGRSRVPLQAEWENADAVSLVGPSDSGCTAARVREWVRVTCAPPRAEITGLTVVAGPMETWARFGSKYRADFLFPVVYERGVALDVHRGDAVYRVRYSRQDASVTLTPDAPPAEIVRDQDPPAVAPGPEIGSFGVNIPYDWIGDLDAGCRNLAWDVPTQLGCGDGRRLALPECGVGEANGGAAGHCHALCSDAVPCGRGDCTPWQGSGLCL